MKTTRSIACCWPTLALSLLWSAETRAQAVGVQADAKVEAEPAASPTAQASATETPANKAPESKVAEPKAQDSARDRETRLNESSTLYGGTGLLRTHHAQGAAAGQFRLGFTTEYFRAAFLCTSEYPCRDPNGGAPRTNDTLDHMGGTLSLSAGILSWLEGYAAVGAYANSDTANRPALLQVLGDTNFGLKAYGRVARTLSLGAGAELWLVNGTGSVGLDGKGTSAKFRTMATLDLRNMPKPAPVRFSLNATYSLDNTGEIVSDTEAARGRARGIPIGEPITRIERYGLRVSRVDHLDLAFGTELLVAKEKVRPFVEYSIDVPLNRQGYRCVVNNPSSDKCLAFETLTPSRLTLGGRFFPWKNGFGLLAAVDIGITGVGTFIEELPPTPPWTLYLGAAWGYDTVERPSVTKVVERAPQGTKVRGRVREKDATTGIDGAVVSYEGHTEWNPIVAISGGTFTTHDLPDGDYTFAIKAEGYKSGTCQVHVPIEKAPAAGSSPVTTPATAPPAGGAPASTADSGFDVDCMLEALPKAGAIVGHVKDAESQTPVRGATLRFSDGKGAEMSAGTDADGAYRFDKVPLGSGTVTVEAEGYMAATETVDIKPREDAKLEISIRKRPKAGLVTVGAKEITIKQQIQFAVDSATILPESNGLLTEIADVLIRNARIRKVEIQGHTDNTGTPERNRRLSDERAASVRNWLTSHGVAGDRLSAKGYGDARPLVPNVTTANRAKNRRVAFVILEQDPAPAAPKPEKPEKGKKPEPAKVPLP